MTRLFKQNVESCWECPGRDPFLLRMDDGLITGPGFCNRFQKEIPPECLRIPTRFNNFPPFCKLKTVYT